MYGVATFSIIDMLECRILTNKWYADDNNVASRLESLRIVLGRLNEHCSEFGYNVLKCYLIPKLEYVQKANTTFTGLNADLIKIPCVLCCIIGSG